METLIQRQLCDDIENEETIEMLDAIGADSDRTFNLDLGVEEVMRCNWKTCIRRTWALICRLSLGTLATVRMAR